jgi:hypothetical protein
MDFNRNPFHAVILANPTTRQRKRLKGKATRMNSNQSLFCPPILTAFLFLSVTSASLNAEQQRPNVILIYSDDHGYADLGVQGVDKDIRTPNIDQLTRDGIQFQRGYVSAPQCVPSRAGVITGRYQQRFGVEDNQQGPLPDYRTMKTSTA